MHLRDELGRRQGQNAKYSLRAFARSLGVSSSFLSKVMNGKKAVGEETFLNMALRLGLSGEVVEKYRAKTAGFKPTALRFDALALDQFQSIADWHHYAILEATTLEDFVPSAAWLARRLGISEAKAKAAVDCLLRLGALTKVGKNKFAFNHQNLSTAHHPAPSAACREHERQVLQLALRALDETPIDKRDQSSVTIAIPSSRLSEARAKIDEFRREMAALLQRKGARDSVYHFSLSLYPVTKP